MRAALLVLAAMLAGCGGPRDPVQELLSEMEAAVEERDATRFGERLSASFRGSSSGMNRTDAVANLRRYFAGYESIALEVYGVEAEGVEGGVRIRCLVEMSGEARKLGGLSGLLPPGASYRFELEAAEEGGALRVKKASWEPAERGPGP